MVLTGYRWFRRACAAVVMFALIAMVVMMQRSEEAIARLTQAIDSPANQKLDMCANVLSAWLTAGGGASGREYDAYVACQKSSDQRSLHPPPDTSRVAAETTFRAA
eukprot:SAG25_NODE_3847_length_950_cov_1.145540_1_plen_105_part_01